MLLFPIHPSLSLLIHQVLGQVATQVAYTPNLPLPHALA